MVHSMAPPALLGELDLHLLAEGEHHRLWEVLGAHPGTDGAGRPGVAFTVWAPKARQVTVVGDFSGWGPEAGHPMRRVRDSGYWEAFVPGAGTGQHYLYRVLGADGVLRDKADPMAARAALPPLTASVVHESGYRWTDQQWLTQRARTDARRRPMSVFEVHLGSWRPGLDYRELATQLTAYVVELGFTHVELMPVMEHPYGGSWGYQVSGYFAPTARFGDPDELRHLIDRLHGAGIGVILDWVPAHFPRDAWALARFDGTPTYEHADPTRGEHPDWGTYVFDCARPEVANFLIANALYWCEEFHADGLRVDAVASMLYLDYSRRPGEWHPNEHGGRENLAAVSFLRRLTGTLRRLHPDVVTIAEESTTWPGVTRPVDRGGLGFTFKWNLGWMHDTLDYLGNDPSHRAVRHHRVTFSSSYAYSEQFLLPLSHDEVVHGKGSLYGKMAGDDWQKRANLRALYALMWAQPGKKLLFMGGETADPREWSEPFGLDWPDPADPEFAGRLGVRRLLRDLNARYRGTPALWSQDPSLAGFRWIDADDADRNTYSFVRYALSGPPLVCVVNFAGVPHERYRLPLPRPGVWREVINTDAEQYGGSGVGNLGATRALPRPHGGLAASAELRLPPLGALWLMPHDRISRPQ